MISNDMKRAQETIPAQSFLPSSSSKITNSRKSIDPTTEVAEPHLLLEENSFPHSSTIAKDNDSKRIDALIEAIHADMFKKEEQTPQKSSLQLSGRKSIPAIDITNPISSEQHFRRTVTFNDDKTSFQSISNRLTDTSHVNIPFSNDDSSPNDQPETDLVDTPYSSDTPVDSTPMNLTIQDLNNLVSGVIPIL
jgi:hypothetical protein